MRRAPAAALLLVALLAAACGSSAPSSGAGLTPGASAGGSDTTPSAAPSGAPTATTSPAPSTPADTSGPSADATPAQSPSAEAPTGSAQPSPSAGAAASPCQPEGDNKSFWSGMANSVSWDVYCAVLPKGWILTGGSYRLANGGKLLVSYKGPGGATLTLSEGSFCTDGSGCVPSGTDTGSAAFGALSGTLVTTDAGGYAIVAARGSTPSWLMVTTGLDQPTTVTLGAALARVGA